MIYYGSRISDNLSSTPEGFLICHNVPIARTGYQDYLGSEFPPGMIQEYDIDPNKIYKVYRSPDEVFSAATIASFEGKPFTDNHPTEMVTTQNISMYGKGHMQNVRRGEGEYKNMLVADVICTDETVANTIKEKIKREVSCGYDYVMKKGSKGFEQTQIRGNHLALVENGRAGQKAAIQDSKPDAIIKQTMKGETNTMAKNIFHKMFAAWAKDAEPEEIEQALGEMNKDAEPAPAPASEANKGGGDLAEIKAALADLTAVVQQLVKSDKQVHEEVSDEDKLNALEKEASDSLADPDEGSEKPEGQLIEEPKAEEDELPEEAEKPMATDAALSEIIKAMKPKLLAIPDEKIRAQAVDAFVAAVKDARTVKPSGKNDYAALAKAVKSNAIATDGQPKKQTIETRLEQQVSTLNKYNPHLKKEDK